MIKNKNEKIPNENLTRQDYILNRKNRKNQILQNQVKVNNIENPNDINNEIIVNDGGGFQNSYNNNINNNLNNEIIQESKKIQDLNEELYLKCKEILDRFNKIFQIFKSKIL